MSHVSILLPVHNAAPYLSATLASLMLQDHGDFEIIAINDGSTDGSGEILHRAARHDPRLRVIERENRGLIATLNEGLSLARADFIARMDADDIAYPGRLSSQLAAFRADPRLALHGCHFDTIYAGERMLPRTPPDATEPEELRVMARFFTILRHPGVMLRRSALPEGVLHYDPAYPCAEDFDLFRRIAALAPVRQGAEPQLAYRLHEGSISATRTATMTRTHLRILQEELSRHYPFAATPGVEELADRVDEETVARAATLVRRLRAMGDEQPPHEARAFRMGADVTFYFLYATICRGHDYRLACEFVAQGGCWDMIRRREHPLLRAARVAPQVVRLAYAAHDGHLGLMRGLRSRAVGRAVPAYGRLSDLARRLAAGGTGGRRAPA